MQEEGHDEPKAKTQTDDQEDESELEDEEELDEDGFPLLAEPSTDILTDLEEALSEDLDFQGSFACSKTYQDAPNPILHLEGVGTVGLPLSKSQARTVIEHCIRAPFGQGERTIVDTEVRDTWEMDASKVQFRNPGWESFMKRVVKEVCEGLGVNIDASKPRCELYKLLIYETGSHFLPHVDTEKTNGMFASIIVILPTEFTGGDAHLSHAGQKVILKTSPSSLTSTTVISWYTDVMHEIKPITSGYRIALSFNLLHSTNSLRPALSAKTEAIENLRHVLLSWKQQKGNTLDKIIYVLDHKYSKANLSAGALKGRDAHLVAVLDRLAKQLGFHLGLANIERHVYGAASHSGYGRWGRYDEDEDEDENDIDIDEVIEESTSVGPLVDLDGQEISSDVDFDEETETIPVNLSESLEEDGWDKQEYEGYKGNYGDTVDRFYRRSALVIWPKWTHLGDDGGDRRSLYALEVLRAVEGSKPTTEEASLFDYVCRSATYLPRDSTMQTLCLVARKWRSASRWVQAIGSFAGIKHSDVFLEETAKAVSVFGFTNISAGLKAMALQDRSNSSRFASMAVLITWAHSLRSEAARTQVLAFVTELKSTFLDNVLSPTAEEMDLITTETMLMGGLQRLLNHILPQLRILASTDTLEAYTKFILANSTELATDEGQRDLLKQIIADLLSAQLLKLDFFELRQTYNPSTRKQENKMDPSIALKFITLCLDCRDMDIATAALDRLVDMGGQSQETAHTRASAVLLPLLPLLNKELSARSSRPQLPLSKISEVAIQLSLAKIDAKGGFFTQEDVQMLVNAAFLGNDQNVLVSTIIPKIRSAPWTSEANWKSCMEELHAYRHQIPGVEVRTVVAEMAQTYAHRLKLPVNHQSSRKALSDSIHPTCQVVEFCSTSGGDATVEILLHRLLQLQSTQHDSQYISGFLLPLLPHLSKPSRISCTAEPLSTFIRKCLSLWATKVLGPKPDDRILRRSLERLDQWTCATENCRKVRQFLKHQPDSTLTLHGVGAPVRKHVEIELNKFAVNVTTYETIRTSPQGLKVTKATSLFNSQQWLAEQQRGISVLKQIGGENELKQIWGSAYPSFMARLSGGPAVPPFQPATSGATNLIAASRAVQQTALPEGVATILDGPAVPSTPAKRKADDVIDLTLSP